MKIYKLLLLISLFLTLVALKYIYLDINDNCYVIIKPYFMPGNMDTKKVIKFLKRTDTEEYHKFCQNVNIIDKQPGCGGLDGGCFYTSSSKNIYLGNDQGDIAFAAAVIIHETCHVLQFKENRTMSEEECYSLGANYLNRITLTN